MKQQIIVIDSNFIHDIRLQDYLFTFIIYFRLVTLVVTIDFRLIMLVVTIQN